jgi:uncharacterized protein YggE
LSGRKLGKVLLIEEANLIYQPIYYGAIAGGQSASLSQQSAAIPAGLIVATVNVLVSWQLI